MKLYIASEAANQTPVITCGFVPEGKNLYIWEAGLEKPFKSNSFHWVATLSL